MRGAYRSPEVSTAQAILAILAASAITGTFTVCGRERRAAIRWPFRGASGRSA